MKKVLFVLAMFFLAFTSYGQSNDSISLPKTVTAVYTGTPLREVPDVNADIKFRVPKGSLLEVIGSKNEYLKVKYDSIEGYLIYFLVSAPFSNEFSAFVQNAKKIEDEKKRIDNEQKIIKRKADLTKKYGLSAANKILDEVIWIGMTENMLLESWGEPEDINTTVTSYVSRKQFVYGSGKYVYVVNGKVDAWQK